MKKKLKTRISLIVCLIFIMSLFAGPVYAAGGTTKPATLFGLVTDSAGNAVVSAIISATGGSGTVKAVTDTTGHYTMTLASGGKYTVTCTAAGYDSSATSTQIKPGSSVELNFNLTKTKPGTGNITGVVTDAATGLPLAGAAVVTDIGEHSTVTDQKGNYTFPDILAGPYNVTASVNGYEPTMMQVTVNTGTTTTQNFALSPIVYDATVTSLTATPPSFIEGTTSSVYFNATVSGQVYDYSWTQISGPKVPLTVVDAAYASVDVSNLAVAVDTELKFRLSVTGASGYDYTKDVSVFVEPKDMFPFLGQNVQIGGASTAVAKFTYNGTEWAIFNIGGKLCTTPIGITKGIVNSINVPGFINDIDLVNYNGKTYALLSAGTAGIVVVDISNPAGMVQVSNVKVNYYKDGITFTEGGGSILTGNVISSVEGPVTALTVDTANSNLYIADSGFGIHRTSLANLLGPAGPVLEADGTLLIDAETYTLQFAGENPWGGPIDLKLYGGKLFACLGELGLGIFDPATLQQVGRYNLYTDVTVTEDWFEKMDPTTAVYHDTVTGEVYLDAFTGMPDYRQTSFEILQVMKNDVAAPTPWADFDRYGKYYYNAQGLDIAEINGRTMAYIASSLGGLIAVDITGYQNAAKESFLNAKYLGYVPAVPANGPSKQTGTQSNSILPYYGAGMLKDSGVVDVKVKGNYVFMTDHFAGLQIINNAATPELSWHGPNAPYNNDTDGIPANHWPDYEFVTSYDMAPYDPLDNESMPKWMYDEPSLLVTGEINGHGNSLILMDNMSLDTAGNVDLLECSGAGGFNFVDIVNLSAPTMAERWAVPVYFPSTAEIGALPDGTPGQTISIGHSVGIDSSDKYIYLSDGPHGIMAWKIQDDNGFATDNIHLVANTLQDEYPEVVNGVKIYPASHSSNVVLDLKNKVAWSGSTSLGLRRVNISGVEGGTGKVGTPLLLPLAATDNYEHNGEFGTVKGVQYQDHAYDCVIRGNYAYVADGSNGLTIYDFTKDPTNLSSGFLAANIGAGSQQPPLGTASGLDLWDNLATGKSYAFIAAGPRGVGVVDITDMNNMKIIKVFEPIKLEDGKVGAADGQAVDVKAIGDYAYFSYDSFGVVCYKISDLIAPLPDGISPTEVWQKNTTGQLVYDYRPVAVSRLKLQLVPGYETWAGGAVKMDYTQVNGKLVLYVAFAEAGVLKIDWTNPASPVLAGIAPTASDCSDVTISNGRLYVADGTGGLIFFK